MAQFCGSVASGLGCQRDNIVEIILIVFIHTYPTELLTLKKRNVVRFKLLYIKLVEEISYLKFFRVTFQTVTASMTAYICFFTSDLLLCTFLIFPLSFVELALHEFSVLLMPATVRYICLDTCRFALISGSH